MTDPPHASAARAASFEFRVLGPVEVIRDGQRLEIGGRRQRALLALLLLAGERGMPPEQLADELWSGSPPPGAETTIRSYVSRLRAALSDALIVSRAPGWALAVRQGELDAQRFESLRRDGQEALARGAAGRAAARLNAAAALWRGQALQDVADAGILAREAARLEELRLVCAAERIDAELALGRHADLVPELEGLVAEEPLRERFWAQLMLALYRSGRQADALAAYRRLRDHLVEELGLEPGQEAAELQRSILRHEVPPVTVPEERHNLPASATSFTGREHELAELDELTRDHRLVTLLGAGGSGKTRLALEVARPQARAWVDGAWLIELAPVTDPSLVEASVAETLGVPERAGVHLRDGLLAHLRRLETLLVLDNCEHVLDACADLAAAILRDCPNVALLATSRTPLGVAGEMRYEVAPLPVPAETASPEQIGAAPSVRLFLDRGRAVRRDLASGEQSLATVGGICRQLDGLPLAIELAAARASVLTVDEIAARLPGRLQPGSRRIWGTDPRHQTLQATMDWSWDLLGEPERDLLSQLSVFAGAFDLDAVADVCFEGDAERALDLIERLVEASLVVAEENRGTMRYRLLETVRQYAGERLAATAADGMVRRRHALHFLRVSEAANLYDESEGEQHYDAAIEASANVRAALAWTLQAGEVQLGLQLTVALENYWSHNPFEGIRWLTELLGRADTVDDGLRARALRVLGGARVMSGEYALGDATYAQSLEIFRALGDEAGTARLLHRRSGMAVIRGELDLARRLSEESLAFHRRVSDTKGEAMDTGTLGDVARAEGDAARAIELFERSEALASKVGWLFWQAMMRFRIGEVALNEGDESRAEASLGQASQLAFRIGDRQLLVFGLARLAQLAHRRGSSELAGTLWGAIEAEERRGPLGQWEPERDDYAATLPQDDPVFRRGVENGRRVELHETVERALSGS